MENGDNKMTYIPTEKEIEMCEEMAQDNWDEEEEYEEQCRESHMEWVDEEVSKGCPKCGARVTSKTWADGDGHYDTNINCTECDY